jgi:hypothetical protein
MDISVNDVLIHKTDNKTATVTSVVPSINPATGEIINIYTLKLHNGKTKTIDETELFRKWTK